VEIYTIGFTKRTAASFFGALKAAGVKQLIDVRLNNSSQLAGFTKRDDLRRTIAMSPCWPRHRRCSTRTKRARGVGKSTHASSWR